MRGSQRDARWLENVAIAARGRWGRPFRQWAWRRLGKRRKEAARAAYGHTDWWHLVEDGETTQSATVLPFDGEGR